MWVEVEKTNENPKAKKAAQEAYAQRLCLWETGLLRESIPSLQGPCDRSLKSEVPCGSCLNWR